MFFVFLILLFTLHVTETDSIALRNNINESRNKYNHKEIVSKKDDIREISRSSTHGPLFHVFKNISYKRPNLQFNDYEKMLSDEMFSIKQFKNKNINSTKIPRFPKLRAPTPTLELKQKWPVIEFLATIKSNIQNDEKRYSKNDIQGSSKIDNNIQLSVKESQNKNKVVELRSIPNELKPNPSHNLPGRFCSCMNSNGFTTCNHKGSSKLCTHTPKSDFRPESSMLTPYPAFYLPYQSFFMGATPDSPLKVTYYHPSIINELKVPKKKKHRYPTTTELDDDIYYENSHSKAKMKYYDYSEDDKDSDEIHKPKKGAVIINIDYDVKNTGKHIEQSMTDPKLNNILTDLDSVYSDCAMKKCYCSSSFNIIPMLTPFLFVILMTHFMII